jgi:geranylgeranyl diphosphate synthase, type I
MLLDQLQAQMRTLPEAAGWPEMISVFDHAQDTPHPDWELPLRVCEAVGGDPALAVEGAAAVACLQISIILVDDMLDDDPRGIYHRLGHGQAANLALAFQAAAARFIENARVAAVQKAALQATLAKAALATAYGQWLDVQNLAGEESYWRVVRAKSTPFYGAAYQIGALLGKADTAVADQLYDLGVLIGEIIQIEDDLTDALKQPANADWQQGRNNLLILYARTADHAQRERFEALLPHVADVKRLEEAQQILAACGAVSYAAYHLIERYRAGRTLLANCALPDPAPISTILEQYADKSLLRLLQAGGVTISKETLLGS